MKKFILSCQRKLASSQRAVQRNMISLRWIPAFAVMTFYVQGMAADAPHWQILPEKSSIEWTANYGGKPVTGSFPAFQTNISFDPAHPEAGSAVVKIGVTSIESTDKDAKESLPTKDWFDSAHFGFAIFRVGSSATGASCEKDCGSFSCTTAVPGAYECTAEGNLTVRDKKVWVRLPFKIRLSDDNATSPPSHTARVHGVTSVKRTALGVGQGDWAATDTIADDVKITVNIEAKQVQ